MLRVGDGNLLDARIQERLPSFLGNIHFRVRWRPDHEPPDGVFVQCPRLRESCGFQFSWIFNVRRKEQVERRSILYLREKVSARTVCNIHFRSRLPLELSRQLAHCKFQICCSGDADFLPLGSHHTLGKESKHDERECAEPPAPVYLSTSHASDSQYHDFGRFDQRRGPLPWL